MSITAKPSLVKQLSEIHEHHASKVSVIHFCNDVDMKQICRVCHTEEEEEEGFYKQMMFQISVVNVCHAVGVKQIWGVHHTDEGIDTGMQLEQQGGPHHAFLFMSDPAANTTTVMRLGDGMNRVLQEESSGIMFTAPTLAAGNVLNYTRIVQVCHVRITAT